MREAWRVYPQNDNYEISTLGKVRRAKTLGCRNNFKQGGLLKLWTNTSGYYSVILYRDGKSKTRTVHQLVLETFVGKRPEGMECNHGDGIKANNKLNNLEWVTKSENHKHAHRLGLMKTPNPKGSINEKVCGEKHGQARLTDANVNTIRILYKNGWSQRALAGEYNTPQSNIFLIVNDKTWKHLLG